MTDHILINGEQIPKREAQDLVRMLENDAKQIAGVFHGMNRSKKFRANWPDEYVFVDAEWKHFVASARAMYADRLGDPKTPPADARKMHLALVLQAMLSESDMTQNPIQLAPNNQQYVGDPYENRKIEATWGKRSDTFRDLLLSTTRLH